MFIFTPVTTTGSQVGMKKDLKFVPVTTPWSQAGMIKDLKYTPALPKGLSSAGHTLRTGARFVPSAEGMITRGKTRIKSEKIEYSLDWWTDTAIFRYNALMVSAFYGLDMWDFREFYNIPRDDFLFVADSGGFQLSRHPVSISPIDVLRWMEHNVDVGLTLDDPPTPEERKNLTLDLLKPHGIKCRKYYEEMHKGWKSDDLELLKVIQGDKPDQLVWWWDLMADLEFDGAALACRPPTAKQTAMGLGFVMDKEVKKVHVLLGTGKATIPLIIYAKKYFDRVTVDSSSFSQSGAIYRSYYLPFNLTQSLEFGEKFTSTIKHLPCDCPVCQITTVDDLNVAKIGVKSDAKKDASLPGGLIALHNLYMVLRYYYFLDMLADDREAYVRFLKTEGYNGAIEAMNFLDDVHERGFEDASKGEVDLTEEYV